MKIIKTLVIIAHPNLHNGSRANQKFVQELNQRPEIKVHSLYDEYTNWLIYVKKEQGLLLRHDRIILQFPMYWYNCPPLLKKWFDDVLEYGWAYGPGGEKLMGKQFIMAITVGGSEDAYQAGGYDWNSISEYTKAFQATIVRCNGTFLPSFITYNTDRLSEEELALEAERYVKYITNETLRNFRF